MGDYWRDALVDDFHNQTSRSCRFCGARLRSTRSRRQHELYHVRTHECALCPEQRWVEPRAARLHANGDHPVHPVYHSPRILANGRSIHQHWLQSGSQATDVLRRCAVQEDPTIQLSVLKETPTDGTNPLETLCGGPPSDDECQGSPTANELSEVLPELGDFSLGDGDWTELLKSIQPDPEEGITSTIFELEPEPANIQPPPPPMETMAVPTQTIQQHLAQARRDLEICQYFQESASNHLTAAETLYVADNDAWW